MSKGSDLHLQEGGGVWVYVRVYLLKRESSVRVPEERFCLTFALPHCFLPQSSGGVQAS